MEALRNILSTGTIPKRLEWEPREVLSLVRWDEYWKEGNNLPDKAFFCSVTLLAASEKKLSASELEGQVDNMIIAIDTAAILGGESVKYLYEFLQYLVPRLALEDIKEDFLYFNLSLCVLSAMLERPKDEVENHIENTVHTEKAVAVYCQDPLQPDIFSYTFFDQRISIWRRYYSKYAKLLEERRNQVYAHCWN